MLLRRVTRLVIVCCLSFGVLFSLRRSVLMLVMLAYIWLPPTTRNLTDNFSMHMYSDTKSLVEKQLDDLASLRIWPVLAPRDHHDNDFF